MDYAQARFNMVEQQIRTWEVLDPAVLELMGDMPREAYVPEEFVRLAYADIMVPLPDGEVMMPPRVEARLLQSLELRSDDEVLEIGTGSGFLTALLARLARHVTSVEISPVLHERAKTRLAAHGVSNVALVLGDAVRGWPSGAPYDAIAVTGSVPLYEEAYQMELRPGGRLFVIVGEPPAMEALLVTRTDDSRFTRESLFETVLPPLRGARMPERFVL